MPAKKPAKPTRLQAKADKKDKVLTGPKGSKPQSTTTNRVRAQGGTTMSKPKPVKPAAPAKPAAKPAAAPAKAAGPTKADAKSWQKMNQLGSAKSAKAAEPKPAKPRTPAPGTGNLLKAAQQFSKDKAAKDRQVNRGVAAFRAKMNQSMVGKAAALVGGLRGGAVQAIADVATPKPTAKGTLSAGGAQGPAMPKRLKEQGYAAQEKKARQKLEARKKATGSSSATPNTAKSFDDAFRDARRAKVSTFTWRGKKYTTQVK